MLFRAERRASDTKRAGAPDQGPRPGWLQLGERSAQTLDPIEEHHPLLVGQQLVAVTLEALPEDRAPDLVMQCAARYLYLGHEAHPFVVRTLGSWWLRGGHFFINSYILS